MSSFIPSEKHFNSCEQAVKNLATGSTFYFPYSLKDSAPELVNKRLYSLDRIEGRISSIFDSLRQLTALCVTLQYRHCYEGKLNREIETQTEILMSQKKIYISLDKLALYKALNCIVYQIETRHLKDLRGLTTQEENALLFINEMIICLAKDVISNLPEYNDNSWSIE